MKQKLAQFGDNVGGDVAGQEGVEAPPLPVGLEAVDVAGPPDPRVLGDRNRVEARLHFSEQVAQGLEIAADLHPALAILFHIHLAFGMFELCDGENFCLQ